MVRIDSAHAFAVFLTMRHVRLWFVALLMAAGACSPSTDTAQSRASAVGQRQPSAGSAGLGGAAGALPAGDNSPGLIIATGGAAPISGRASGDNCSDAAKLVYVVDQDGRFSSFNPATDPPSFVDITRQLTCPARAGGLFDPQPSPYSMSVDRNAVAWVLYTTGELFRVSTADGSCQATSFKPNQSGFQLMGMGFVANDPMSTLDTLYVAGGEGPDTGGASRLGTVDTTTLVLTPAQTLTGWPELTGTGLAELWAFYPDTSPPKVAKLNKSSGAEETVFPLAALQGVPSAWAFAFWGGDFWLFLMRVDDTDTTVYRVDAASGAMTVALQNTGRRIVGAGVSTCAPVSPQ